MTYVERAEALGQYRYFRMGNASSPITDEEGIGALTVTGGTFDVTGALTGGEDDGAVSFNGTTDSAFAAMNLSDTAVVTIAGFVKWDAYADNDALLLEHTPNFGTNLGGFLVDMGNSTGGAEAGTISIGMNGSGGRFRVTTPRTNIPAGEWHHFAFVLDFATPAIKVYVDGLPVTTTGREGNSSPGQTFADSTLFFMSRNSASLFGAGALDEISIAKRELTSDEIADLAGVPPVTASVIYVDQDNPAASDARTRTEALNPGTPFKTVTAACAVAIDDDQIEVAPSAGQYDIVEAQLLTATGVTVRGSANPPFMATNEWSTPALRLISLDSWSFQECNTRGPTQGSLSFCYASTDMTWRNLRAETGGMSILHPIGSWLFDGGSVDAPLTGPIETFLDGVGFRVHYLYGDQSGIGNIEFRDFTFQHVQGEDGVQFLAGRFQDGELRFTRCKWRNFTQSTQPNTPHTDGVQLIGGDQVIFDSCEFDDVPSMIISTDDIVNKVTIVNTKLGVGGGYACQFFGALEVEVINSTANTGGFADLRIGYDNRLGVINTKLTLINNILANIVFTEGVDDPANDFAADFSDYVGPNLIGSGALRDNDLRGFAEYGTSGDTDLELANDPINSPGIDAGISHADDARVPVVDRLGRSRHGATDLGCHESNPGVLVQVDPRPPHIVSITPADGAINVARSSSWVAVVYPKPGETLDGSSITSGSAFLVDASGRTIPTAITISGLDENGYQSITLDPRYSPTQDGLLDYLVQYTAHLTGIADTEGSVLADLTAGFRVVDRGTAAIVPITAAGSQPTSASLFGSMRGNPTLEQAALNQLATWLPTYLWETERQHGLRLGTLIQPPAPESYVGGLDFDSFQQDICPMVMVNVNPTGNTERTGTTYGQWFEMQIGVPVITRNEHDSRLMAGYYGIAVQGAVMQRGGLGGIATRTVLVSAPTVEFPDPEDRVLARCVTVFHVFMNGIVDEAAGPRSATPPDSPQYPGTPDAPYRDVPVVLTTPITLVADTPE